MQPVLFYIPYFNLPVYGYGVMLGLSFIFGWYLTMFLVNWYGLDEDKLVVAIVIALISAMIGARLFHVITNLQEDWTLARMLNFQEGGLVAYGGYIFGIGSGIIYWKIKRVFFWTYLDIATPALALGLGLTRLGCFLRGCCYGIRHEGVFSLSFPKGSLVVDQHVHRGWPLLENGWSTPVIPTQLISSAAGFSLFLLAIFALYKMKQIKTQKANDETAKPSRFLDGHIFLGFVALYSLFRFLLEFIRDDGGRGTVGILSSSQFIGLLLIAFMAFMAFYWLPKHQHAEKMILAEHEYTKKSASKKLASTKLASKKRKKKNKVKFQKKK